MSDVRRGTRHSEEPHYLVREGCAVIVDPVGVAFGPVPAAQAARAAGAHVRSPNLPEVWAVAASRCQAACGCDHQPVSILGHFYVVNQPAVGDIDRPGLSPIAPYLTGLRVQHGTTAACFVGHRVDTGSLAAFVRVT